MTELLLISFCLIAAPARLPAQTDSRLSRVLTLLQVPFNDGSGGEPPADPAAPSTRGGGDLGCGGGLTTEQLNARLHRGGKKRAVVVRGGKFGIHPELVKMKDQVAFLRDETEKGMAGRMKWTNDVVDRLAVPFYARLDITEEDLLEESLSNPNDYTHASGYKVEP